MTSKEALKEIKLMFKGIDEAECFDYAITNKEYYAAIEKDLELLESIKEVFKKVYHTPEYIYEEEDENGMIPIKYAPKVKIAEDFDRELFRQVLEQCGFEIKEK